jgi:hypothetical protein
MQQLPKQPESDGEHRQRKRHVLCMLTALCCHTAAAAAVTSVENGLAAFVCWALL